MQLRSNSLFHFTPKMEFLLDTIKNKGFWPRYCKEYGWGNQYENFALPMVCFCDIPLSLIKEHADFYGKFGIGMKRNWVVSNKNITPVQYINNRSSEAMYIKRCLTKLKNNEINESEIRSLCLAKKVSGKVYKEAGGESTKILYNEREWRYVPEIEKFKIISIPQHDQNYNLDEHSLLFENLRVNFEIKDIEYLIIPNDHYRDKLINQINKNISKHSKSERLNLISRIISIEQILKDF